MGPPPVQSPTSGVSGLLSRAVSGNQGAPTFSGGCIAPMTSPSPLSAVSSPPRLWAVTDSFTLPPSAAPGTTKLCAVAPSTFSQPSPSASQSCHWKSNDFAGGDHSPTSADRVSPTLAEPSKLGGPELTGGSGSATTAVGAECSEALPRAFSALISSRRG